MRVRTRALAAATLLTVTGLAVIATPSRAGQVVILSQGHIDAVDAGYDGGTLGITIHDETVEPAVERDPATVVMVAKPQAAVQVPADPAYAFLGAPGATVRILPEVQDERLLWPGLATEEIPAGVFQADSVDIRFRQVIAPDGLSLFTTGPGGEPNVLLDTEDALPDRITLPVGTHQHANWAFERPGIYLVKVDVTGRLVGSGVRVASPPVWLKFVVLP